MEILKLDFKKIDLLMARALKAIKEGQVLVCPTDTVYGLICDFKNKKAMKRLYRIKKRPKWKPLPVFVKNIKMAEKLAEINPEQKKFLEKKWPGAVTVILKAKKRKVKIDSNTIGLRIPRYKFVLDSVKRMGPLAESSANISGKPASTKIQEVLRQFRNKKYRPDLVIDAGDLKKSRPSKVIDLTVWPPKILRF